MIMGSLQQLQQSMADLQRQQSENKREILSLQSRFDERTKVGDRYRRIQMDPFEDPFGPVEGGGDDVDVQQATRLPFEVSIR